MTFFPKKSQKSPSCCDAIKLHQFAEFDAKIKTIFEKKTFFNFRFKPFFSKIVVARLTCFNLGFLTKSKFTPCGYILPTQGISLLNIWTTANFKFQH